MVFFLLSILSSTAILLVFKLFERFGIQTFQAIVFNYWTAFLFGLFFVGPVGFDIVLTWKWKSMALLEGILFISIFNVMALTVQRFSITVGSVASRTAMVIPAAVLLLIDPRPKGVLLKSLGILLACIAVYLASRSDKEDSIDTRYLYLPLILFIGSGLIDLILGYSQEYLMSSPLEKNYFIPSIFAVAASIGTVILLYRYRIKRNIRWQSKDLIAGLALGLINYASILFILEAIETKLIHSSLFFPVNNMGVILAGSALGLIFFKEKLRGLNYIGLLLGLASILLMVFAEG